MLTVGLRPVVPCSFSLSAWTWFFWKIFCKSWASSGGWWRTNVQHRSLRGRRVCSSPNNCSWYYVSRTSFALQIIVPLSSLFWQKSWYSTSLTLSRPMNFLQSTKYFLPRKIGSRQGGRVCLNGSQCRSVWEDDFVVPPILPLATCQNFYT